MHLSDTPNRPSVYSPRPKPGPIGRWYLPMMALIGLGFGLSNYYQCTRPAQIKAQLDEEERLGRNRRLTEAYGGKDNLEDIERALEIYEVH